MYAKAREPLAHPSPTIPHPTPFTPPPTPQVLIQAGRLPEAAFFARTYQPSAMSEVVRLWKADLKSINAKVRRRGQEHRARAVCLGSVSTGVLVDAWVMKGP